MINSADKISTRVSCSIVVIFIVFSQVDVILSNYDINWYGSLMFLDSGNLTFVFSKRINSVAD
jgi:hypothetical protein